MLIFTQMQINKVWICKQINANISHMCEQTEHVQYTYRKFDKRTTNERTKWKQSEQIFSLFWLHSIMLMYIVYSMCKNKNTITKIIVHSLLNLMSINFSMSLFSLIFKTDNSLTILRNLLLLFKSIY